MLRLVLMQHCCLRPCQLQPPEIKSLILSAVSYAKQNKTHVIACGAGAALHLWYCVSRECQSVKCLMRVIVGLLDGLPDHDKFMKFKCLTLQCDVINVLSHGTAKMNVSNQWKLESRLLLLSAAQTMKGVTLALRWQTIYWINVSLCLPNNNKNSKQSPCIDKTLGILVYKYINACRAKNMSKNLHCLESSFVISLKETACKTAGCNAEDPQTNKQLHPAAAILQR